jgi:hypothetical protein
MDTWFFDPVPNSLKKQLSKGAKNHCVFMSFSRNEGPKPTAGVPVLHVLE